MTDDRKKVVGFVGQVPGTIQNMLFKQNLVNQFGLPITKMGSVDNNGNPIILKGFPGFAKSIYKPAVIPSGEKPITEFFVVQECDSFANIYTSEYFCYRTIYKLVIYDDGTYQKLHKINLSNTFPTGNVPPAFWSKKRNGYVIFYQSDAPTSYNNYMMALIDLRGNIVQEVDTGESTWLGNPSYYYDEENDIEYFCIMGKSFGAYWGIKRYDHNFNLIETVGEGTSWFGYTLKFFYQDGTIKEITNEFGYYTDDWNTLRHYLLCPFGPRKDGAGGTDKYYVIGAQLSKQTSGSVLDVTLSRVYIRDEVLTTKKKVCDVLCAPWSWGAYSGTNLHFWHQYMLMYSVVHPWREYLNGSLAGWYTGRQFYPGNKMECCGIKKRYLAVYLPPVIFMDGDPYTGWQTDPYFAIYKFAAEGTNLTTGSDPVRVATIPLSMTPVGHAGVPSYPSEWIQVTLQRGIN